MALLVIGLILLVFSPVTVLASTSAVNYGLRWQSSLLLVSGILFLVGGMFEFFLGMLGATLRKEADRALSLMIFGGLVLGITLIGAVLILLAKSPVTQQSGTFVLAGINMVLLAVFIIAANLNRKANKAIEAPLL